MTREKAIQVDHLLCKLELYEILRDEITSSQVIEEIWQAFKDDIEGELLAIVEARINKLNKELEEM